MSLYSTGTMESTSSETTDTGAGNKMDISITDGEGKPIDLSKVSSFGELQQNNEDNEDHWIPTPTRTRNSAIELKAGEKREESDDNTPTASVGTQSDTNSSSGGGAEEEEEAERRGRMISLRNEHPLRSDDAPHDTNVTRTEHRTIGAPPLPPLSLSAPQIPLICLSAGLSRKASPSQLKSWVALSLTLDGRDKITKCCQYASRLLAWYYETLASSLGGNLLTNDATVAQLLQKAQKLRGLQAKLTESRKAYRLGRSLVELDKLRGMGWGTFLAYHLKHLVVSSNDEGGEEKLETIVHTEQSDKSNVGWGATTTISAEGTIDTANARRKGDDEPPRLLLRRASTNVGWGPATTATSESLAARTKMRSASFYRSVSNLGRRMYRPLASQLVAAYSDSSVTTPPAWKIIGATLKLLGLMGFWMGDNVNFLGSSGLFDDVRLPREERAKSRVMLRRKAGHFAARAYFLGAISGLYVNLREVLRHRAGPLREAVKRVQSLEQKESRRNSWDLNSDQDSSSGTEVRADDDVPPQLASARSDLEKIKGKQFVLFLSLVKVSTPNDDRANVCIMLLWADCTSHHQFLLQSFLWPNQLCRAIRAVAMFLSLVIILASTSTNDTAARR